MESKSIDQLGDSFARAYNGLWLGLPAAAHVQVTTMRFALFSAASRISNRVFFNGGIETGRCVWQMDTLELQWVFNILSMFYERTNMKGVSTNVTFAELLDWCDEIQLDWADDMPKFKNYVETLILEFIGYARIPSKDSEDV